MYNKEKEISQMKKWIVSLLLALVMMFGMIPINIFAEDMVVSEYTPADSNIEENYFYSGIDDTNRLTCMPESYSEDIPLEDFKTTQEQLAVDIRTAMENRESTFNVYYVSTELVNNGTIFNLVQLALDELQLIVCVCLECILYSSGVLVLS